jgi:hypothetical protein
MCDGEGYGGLPEDKRFSGAGCAADERVSAQAQWSGRGVWG